MAMMTREPGFLGMAKRKAQKQGMLTIPKRWTPQGGGEEYPAFINQQEMALLKQQGGQGFMTPYGIPSFDKDTSGYGEDEGASAAQSGETGQSVSSGLDVKVSLQKPILYLLWTRLQRVYSCTSSRL